MKKWEYRLVYIAHGGQDSDERSDKNPNRMLWEEEIENQLNMLGEEGWELFSFPDDILNTYEYSDGYALFKRAKED